MVEVMGMALTYVLLDDEGCVDDALVQAAFDAVHCSNTDALLSSFAVLAASIVVVVVDDDIVV